MTFEWKKGAVVSERKLVWDILRNWMVISFSDRF
jgi:hypothetical protein